METDMDKKIRFTRHATQRGEDAGLTFRAMEYMAYNSIPDSTISPQCEYKMSKYGDDQKDVFYTKYERFLFTCLPANDSKTNQPIVLVLTMTDTLKAKFGRMWNYRNFRIPKESRRVKVKRKKYLSKANKALDNKRFWWFSWWWIHGYIALAGVGVQRQRVAFSVGPTPRWRSSRRL